LYAAPFDGSLPASGFVKRGPPTVHHEPPVYSALRTVNKRSTWLAGTYDHPHPRTRTFYVLCVVRIRRVENTVKLTTPAMSAPLRASSSTVVPQQYPMAAIAGGLRTAAS
jgi:hypothetical protein